VATKDIRLQYSGFVIFAAKIVSVLTGLIFQFIVARALNKVEYDLWFNINDITNYFVLLSGVLPFWVMRYVTRDKDGSAKTGLFANLGISAVASMVYILLIPTVMSALHVSPFYLPTYLLMAIQIVEVHSIAIMESCLQARIPQRVGYGLLVQQFCKVLLGYVLIVLFNQLLLGAVVATIAAFAVQTFYYVRTLFHELRKRLCVAYVREWLKGSLFNVYNVIGNQIAAYIFIMLFAYGGEGARGILGAGATIVNVITYSSFLSFALYPKLLAEKKMDDVASTMKMVLMFAIPLTVGALAIPDAYITLLRPETAGGGPVLMVLALDAFVMVISGFYTSVLYGMENVDEGSRLSLRQLAKSRLFVAFSLPYLHSAITLPTAFYMLTNYAQNQPFQAALYVSAINAIARFAMFIILYVVVRSMVKVHIPWKGISKYVLAAAVMGTVLYLIPHPTRISTTLIETAAGGLIYLGLLMAVDKEARRLPRDIIGEFRHKQAATKS
jgi:O-antigen/teichoic acid export membrane protein